jgi:2-C-methyl-D-erythritol 4-phosphate cytidylyltransferase
MLSTIIVAAGSSTRAGFDKLFAILAGRPVIEHSIGAFQRSKCVDEIIVVGREATLDSLHALTGRFRKIRAVVQGGERRQDSVRAGLDAVSNTDFIAVHDAARPLITAKEIERVFAAAVEHGAAALAAPVGETLKIADRNQCVIGSIDRENVFAMQTPQIFARDLLVEAYNRVAKDSLAITDEVSAVQHAGGHATIVRAEDHNPKITFPNDLAVAELILRARKRS